MSTTSLIDEIAGRLQDAAPSKSTIVLFGSHARGDDNERSDVDVLVIEPEVDDPIRESVRLRRALRGLKIAVDVIVVSRVDADERASVSGTLVDRALREGTVLIDA